jgi:transcriptional regulator with XRE-family HTH domain
MARSPVTRNPSCPEAVALRAFGGRVRRTRQLAGLSQETAAMVVGLHPTYLSDIEQGYRNVSLLTVIRLVDGFDIDSALLMHGLTLEE